MIILRPVPLVTLDQVAKRYTIFHRKAGGLKDRAIAALSRRPQQSEELWALKDVSLTVDRGETLGLIGPNGCGKSTLLQLVAGILVPDAGRVDVAGRVTSLLELGAGFSPDLSGRENIFLNASLHGLARAPIESRFEEIVAFAELERFIDTPVRNYSSGMYMRLGFAVAVHLDPEIILIDEAFAVGDESFQRKCLRKLRDFQKQGVTIILVSHDLNLIEQFSSRACLLESGRLVTTGPPVDVISHYHATGSGGDTDGAGRRWGSREIEITGVSLFSDGHPPGVCRPREPLTIRLSYCAKQRVEHPVFGLAIYREDGAHVTGPNTKTSGFDIPSVSGEGELEYHIESVPLLPGRYSISVAVYDQDLVNAYDHRDRFTTLVVVEGTSLERFGLVELPAHWSFAGAPVA